MKDCYQTLGLTESASAEDIKKAYRKLAMQYHPDRGTGDEAKFKEINEANEILSDPAKKAKYDQQRKFGQTDGFNFGKGGFNERNQFEEILRQHFGREAQDVVDEMFGFRRSHKRPKPLKNRDIMLKVQVQLKDLLSKVTKTVTYKTTKGDERTVDIHLPHSLSDQQHVRILGMGDNAQKDYPDGDLIIDFHVVIPDGFWMEQGNILCSTLKIPVWTALLGGTARFENYDDTELEVKIPAGTQFGQRFVLKGKGVKISEQFITDLLLLIHIDIPKELDEKEKELIRQISDIKKAGD